jgi:hypothetical protein
MRLPLGGILVAATALTLTAAPAAHAHGSCTIVNSGAVISFSGSFPFRTATGEIDCTSTHNYYSVEVCIQWAAAPAGVAYRDLVCGYSTYNGASGPLSSWSQSTALDQCYQTGWYRSRVVAQAGSHPFLVDESPGGPSVC